MSNETRPTRWAIDQQPPRDYPDAIWDPINWRYIVSIPRDILQREGINCGHKFAIPRRAVEIATDQAIALDRHRHRHTAEVRKMIARNKRRRFGPK